MAPGKKNGSGKALGTPNQPSPPPRRVRPRPRLLCPACSAELTVHKTLSISQAFIYASKNDMKKLDLECNNESCAIYIEGLEGVDDQRPVNPTVEKIVEIAKNDRAAIKATEKEEKQENNKRKREEKKAEYAEYNPFSGAKEMEAEEAIHRAKRQKIETEKIVKGWKKIQRAAERLEKLENAANSAEE